MKKNTEKKDIKKLEWIDDKFAIQNVKNISDNCTFFNLYIKSAVGNIAIYGAKVVSSEGHDDFIAYPSQAYKASDGSTKYSNYCSIIFDDGMQQRIIDEVAKLI